MVGVLAAARGAGLFGFLVALDLEVFDLGGFREEVGDEGDVVAEGGGGEPLGAGAHFSGGEAGVVAEGFVVGLGGGIAVEEGFDFGLGEADLDGGAEEFAFDDPGDAEAGVGMELEPAVGGAVGTFGPAGDEEVGGEEVVDFHGVDSRRRARWRSWPCSGPRLSRVVKAERMSAAVPRLGTRRRTTLEKDSGPSFQALRRS